MQQPQRRRRQRLAAVKNSSQSGGIVKYLTRVTSAPDAPCGLIEIDLNAPSSSPGGSFEWLDSLSQPSFSSRRQLPADALVRRRAFLDADFRPQFTRATGAASQSYVSCSWPFPAGWCQHIGWLAPKQSMRLDSAEFSSDKPDKIDLDTGLYDYSEALPVSVDASATTLRFRLDSLPTDEIEAAAVIRDELTILRAWQPGLPAGRYLTELRANLNCSINKKDGLFKTRALNDLLAPRSASGVLGNAEAVRKLADWMSTASANAVGRRMALIEGPGRSCVARAIARQSGLRVLEIGAEERRHGPQLAQRLQLAATCCQVVQRKRRRESSESKEKEAKDRRSPSVAEDEATDTLDVADLSVSGAWLILLDDVDNPHDDEPNLRRLIADVCAVSRKPVLLAAADAELFRRGVRCLSAADAAAPIFRLRRPTRPLVAAYARVLCLGLGRLLTADAAVALVDACRGDIGQLLNTLHWLLLGLRDGDVNCRLSIAVTPAPIDAALLAGAAAGAFQLKAISRTADVVVLADRLRRRRRRCIEAADRLASAGLSLMLGLLLLPSNSGESNGESSTQSFASLEPRPALTRLLRDLRQSPGRACRPFGRDEALDRAAFMRSVAVFVGYSRRSLVRYADRRVGLTELSESALHYLLKCNSLVNSQ